MPSRARTAPRALASILPQVDRLWLFLDRFDEVPPYAADERIQVIRSEDVGDLRANGKLVALVHEDACTFFGVDDDVEYPPDYCATLESALGRYGGRAAVGVHAAVLLDRVESYGRDMKVLHRRSGQARAAGVDLLGSDSIAFRASTLRFDVSDWPDVNMVDLSLALEARRRAVPFVMVARRPHWLSALDEDQEDAIWTGVLHDDSRQTELAQELLSLPRPQLPRNGWRRLSYRSV